MYQNINLNLLKYYYEVVNNKNITKASQILLVSQPAITKAIKELETELNVKLLDRSKKGVVPTNEGLILYNHIKEMFQNLNTTLNTIETENNSINKLYIGATTTNFLSLIEKTLKKFKKLYPNIQIDITLEGISVLDDKAKLGKMDIVIKNDYEYINSFEHIKSFEIGDKFVASSIYFKELEDKIWTLEELINNYPFVLLSPITHGRRNFDKYLKQNNINFKPTYEFNSYSLCRELIKDGFGIGIGNPIHYQDKEFIIINTDFNLPVRIFDIGYIKTSKNKIIKDFIKLLNEDNKND